MTIGVHLPKLQDFTIITSHLHFCPQADAIVFCEEKIQPQEKFYSTDQLYFYS